MEITKSHVKIQTGETIEEIPADSVVLAAGAAPVKNLAALLDKKGIGYQVAGDASGIALAFDAIHQGFDAGRRIQRR